MVKAASRTGEITPKEAELPKSTLRLIQRDLVAARERLQQDSGQVASESEHLVPVGAGLWVSVRDRLQGIYFGITARDRFVDVFAHYKRQLRADFSKFLSFGQTELDAITEVREQRISQRDQRVSEVLSQLRADVEWFDERVKEEQAAYENRRDHDPDLAQARSDYMNWHAALGRPPYTERFSRLGPTAPVDDGETVLVGPHDARESSSNSIFSRLIGLVVRSGDGSQDRTPAQIKIHRFVELISSGFVAILSVVLIPSEVVFTLPAFEAILGVSEDEAVIAALIFTTAMALIGYGIASFATRTYTRRLKPNPQQQSPTIEGSKRNQGPERLPYTPHLNTFWALGTIGLCAIGLLFAVYGATIRGRVPEVYAINKEVNLISETQRKADARRATGNLLPEQLTELEKADRARQLRLTELSKKRESLRDPNPDFYAKADGWVAFLIYLTLICSYAIHRNFSNDPIFEYEIAAKNYAQQKAANRLALEQHLQRKVHYSSRLEALKQKLSDVENRRYVEVPELAELHREIEDLNKRVRRVGEEQSRMSAAEDIYIRIHLVRFALYFCMFRIRPDRRTWRLLLRHFPRIEVADV